MKTLLLLALIFAVQDSPKKPGGIKGTVDISATGVKLADIGLPLIVFLDGVEGKIPFDVPKEKARMSQTNAKFSPEFLVVTVGQSIEMPNDDDIVHNVFSYSKGNEFDLGLYAKGESRDVAFKVAGIVNIFCSIHASMKGTILVAPSPYYARVNDSGGFELAGIPPGRYKLRSWGRKIPEAVVDVEVVEDKVTEAKLKVEAKKK